MSTSIPQFVAALGKGVATVRQVSLEYRTSPYYAQVALRDLGAIDVPAWADGNEPAVASAQVILVATRPDTDGDVVIRVTKESPSGELPEAVFSGVLDCRSGVIEVGSIISGEFAAFPLGEPSRVGISVFAEPSDAAERVLIFVSDPRS